MVFGVIGQMQTGRSIGGLSGGAEEHHGHKRLAQAIERGGAAGQRTVTKEEGSGCTDGLEGGAPSGERLALLEWATAPDSKCGIDMSARDLPRWLDATPWLRHCLRSVLW